MSMSLVAPPRHVCTHAWYGKVRMVRYRQQPCRVLVKQAVPPIFQEDYFRSLGNDPPFARFVGSACW